MQFDSNDGHSERPRPLPGGMEERFIATNTARTAPRKCLLLHVEPTTYICHKLVFLKSDSAYDFDVYFVTGKGSQNWGLQDVGGEVLEDPTAGILTRMKRFLGLTAKIVGGKFSVALVAGWGTPTLLWFSLLLRLSGIPFCFDSDTQLAKSRRGFKEAVKRAIYPSLFRAASALLPAGKRQAEFFKAYGVREDHIHLQHMTVDVNQIRSLPMIEKSEFRRANGIAEESVVYIFVGRLERVKALDILFAAFEKVSAKQEGSILIVVGDGSMRSKVEGWAARSSSVRYVGRQGFTGVMQWMRASDVFVLASTIEPWGLVVNEAMACGLPVIASDRVGSVDDLVLEGQNGFVVPAGDADALAAAMLKLVSAPELRKRMGEVSEQIIANWTMEAEVARIKQVLALVSR